LPTQFDQTFHANCVVHVRENVASSPALPSVRAQALTEVYINLLY